MKKQETRVKRYSKKNILKRKAIKKIKWFIKEVLKNIVYLIVGIAYTLYILIRAFDNLVIKLFMKLPRISRAVIIWSLVVANLYHNFGFEIEQTIKSVRRNQLSIVEVKAEETIEEEIEEEKICIYDNISCLIIDKAKEVGMNDEQALISVAISKWETGNYTSSLFINNNNVGGMYCNGKFIVYNTLEEGVSAFVYNLKNNYFDIGLNTIEKIKNKYCPDGAENDPNNLNPGWTKGVYAKLNELKK